MLVITLPLPSTIKSTELVTRRPYPRLEKPRKYSSSLHNAYKGILSKVFTTYTEWGDRDSNSWNMWLLLLYFHMDNFSIRRNLLISHRAEFHALAHSEGIATLPSLIVLDGILTTYKIQKVLEIGRGLGTLTKFMSVNYNVDLYSVESDPYCIEQSALNCGGAKYSHFQNISSLPSEILTTIDLVVVDGPISKREINQILLGLNPRIYFFENHQLISKIRIFLKLVMRMRFIRYVEIFPDHNFEGPGYIVSLPVHSKLTFVSNNLALAILLFPRAIKHFCTKLVRFENPLVDSYHLSKWNPNKQK